VNNAIGNFFQTHLLSIIQSLLFTILTLFRLNMHQEAELCLPAHSIVSPTPPPDGSEEDQKVDMMLNPLVGNDVALTPTADASTPIMMDAAATTPPAEVNRPGLRKRKNTSDHYLCDRVRHQ
jgi:hypothetical protein